MNLNSPVQGLALPQPSAGFPLLQSRLQAQPFPKTPPRGIEAVVADARAEMPGCSLHHPREPSQEGGGARPPARRPAPPLHPEHFALSALSGASQRSALGNPRPGRESRGAWRGEGAWQAWAWLAEDGRAGVKGVTQGRAWCKGLDKGRGGAYKPRPWHVPLSLHPPTLERSVGFSSQRTSRARAARALAAGTSSRRWRRGRGKEAISLSAAAGAAQSPASLQSSRGCGLSAR